MTAIYDLNSYQLYQLHNITPALDAGWQRTLYQIFPILDRDNQLNLLKRFLEPRDIFYDATNKRLVYQPTEQFETFITQQNQLHPKIKQVVALMQKVLSKPFFSQAALDIADTVEHLLSMLENVEVDDDLVQQRIKLKLRDLFLTAWIAQLRQQETLEVQPGIRQLTSEAVKHYISAVYAKQQLQGWDFRTLDEADLPFLPSQELSKLLQTEIEVRKFSIAESEAYWFLIGPTAQADQNPFSLRRFLHEDQALDGKIVYLTHVAIEKKQIADFAYQQAILKQISRIYTLERKINEELKTYVEQIRRFQQQHIAPLLKKPLSSDGSDVETVIRQRMTDYEKQFSVLSLGKLPRILMTMATSRDEQDFLFYQFDKLLKEMVNDLEDFMLQPVVSGSNEVHGMMLRLACMSHILRKNKTTLIQCATSREETQALLDPLEKLKQLLDHHAAHQQQITALKEAVSAHEQRKSTGSLWSKLSLGRKPAYTLEELEIMAAKLNEETFISIVRLAKDYRHIMVYPEFEFQKILDQAYRHYAFPSGRLGIGELPRLVRLPEARQTFQADHIRQTVERDIFETSQGW